MAGCLQAHSQRGNVPLSGPKIFVGRHICGKDVNEA